MCATGGIKDILFNTQDAGNEVACLVAFFRPGKTVENVLKLA